VLNRVDPSSGTTERVSTRAIARTFAYDAARHRATYLGDARISGGAEGTIAATRIDVYLGSSDRTLDRIEGADDVRLEQAGRRITGTKLTYTTATEQYVVTGRPVMMRDACGNETTGETLTFAKASGRLTVSSRIIWTTTKIGAVGRLACR
jgi:lipopolysaccharide export system protein LptA